jgi:hypothetical protein
MGHGALSIRRAETGNKVMLMQPSDYLLDNFVAHKMSSITECRAPELSMGTWLNAFILNSVNRGRLVDKHHAYAFNMIRRAEGAFSAYREARQALSEYITTPDTPFLPTSGRSYTLKFASLNAGKDSSYP